MADTTTTIAQPPYTYDIVGSFLRPASLKEARADFAAGKLSRTALAMQEDLAIADLVAKEKAAGLRAVTDGEFRRAMWHLDFLEALERGHQELVRGVQGSQAQGCPAALYRQG